MSFYYKPYVPVAKRREKALKQMEKLKKKGVDVQPVDIQGRKITKTFWGNAWCDHIEKFCDNDNRLPRGRTYVRNGSVCHLNIQAGMVSGIVSGSELYKIEIKIDKLKQKKWEELKRTCSGKVGSILELLQGTLSSSVMEIVTEPNSGLMPRLGGMKFKCNCPDWASMCKHVASVLYGVGARLDTKPELLFELRGVDPSELVDTVDIPDTDISTELEGDLSALFGVEIDSEIVTPPVKTPQTNPKSATDNEVEPIVSELEKTARSKKGVPKKRVLVKKVVPKKAAPKQKVPVKKALPKKAVAKKAVSKQKVQAKKAVPKQVPKKPAKTAILKTIEAKTKQLKAEAKPFKPTKTAIKQLRKRLDLNKAQFAKLVSVSPTTVSSWENKPGRVSLQPASEKALIKVARLTKAQAWKRLGLS